MKIPFEDRRMSMNRRWTDIQKIHEFRFSELSDLIENCRELDKKIRHDVCPQCAIHGFPKFYRVHESPAERPVNGTLTKKFFSRFSRTADLNTLSIRICCL
jgi:hypothetical protein